MLHTPLLPPPLTTVAVVLVMVAVNLEKYKPQQKNYFIFHDNINANTEVVAVSMRLFVVCFCTLVK